MLDDQQKDIVIKQLQENLNNLKSEKSSYVRRIADYGNSLHKVITEIDDLEDVLDTMQTKKCDECDE